jgi:uncharacterized protein YcbK (DUF882 family)
MATVEVLMTYFKIEEFTCMCGCGFNNASPKLLARLEMAREMAGVEFIVTSGCRCAEHNAKVGGVAGSTHVHGDGADIAFTAETREFILTALKQYFTRIGISDEGHFFHVDVDDSRPDAIWYY